MFAMTLTSSCLTADIYRMNTKRHPALFERNIKSYGT